MIVNKFGGASVKDADSIKSMAKICESHINNGIIVVSAMGKTTNLLEKIADHYFSGLSTQTLINKLETYYNNILEDLFDHGHSIFNELSDYFNEINSKISTKPGLNFDFEYDQIVPYGEIISTKIISAYLNSKSYKVVWKDIRNSLKTDSNYREGKVDWELSSSLIEQEFTDTEKVVYLTQGFIGIDINNLSTTLGREGSDYSAAILANVLNAEKVVVWKDVPGILCADPAWLPNSDKLDEISYLEAIELTFFGAKVIHPKTIKPLQNKNIPLQVRSFIDTNSNGTLINYTGKIQLPPVFIKKENQVMITIKPLDFSFIAEDNLSLIFNIFAENQIKVNVMQNSAISFTVAVDGEIDRVKNAIRELKKQFDVKYNDNLELISIRHTTQEAEAKVITGRKLMLEQRSRSTVRFVVRADLNA